MKSVGLLGDPGTSLRLGCGEEGRDSPSSSSKTDRKADMTACIKKNTKLGKDFFRIWVNFAPALWKTAPGRCTARCRSGASLGEKSKVSRIKNHFSASNDNFPHGRDAIVSQGLSTFLLPWRGRRGKESKVVSAGSLAEERGRSDNSLSFLLRHPLGK